MLDIIRVCAGLVAEQWLPLLGLLVACALAAGTDRLAAGRLPERAGDWSRRLLLTLFAVGGLALAWQVLWLCDDAFISFRYSRNFAEGHGLVFNPGEWVEGYTNFLWTFLLGLLGKLGASIPHAALYGDLAAFVLALFAVSATVRRIAPGPILVPFGALFLAGIRPFHTFASSGLETMPAALLVAVGMWASTLRHGAFWSGLALIGAVLMRPDQSLLYGAMGLALVAEDLLFRTDRPWLRRLDLRRYVAYALPFLLLYVPYFLWRWQAYGDFYPNTYYAKSGHLSYYAQGGRYLVHFLFSTGAFLWFPLFVALLFGRRRNRDETRLRIFAAVGVPLFVHYVWKVGGDFMEHRFLVSLLPIVAVVGESSIRWRLLETGSASRRLALAAVAVPALALALLPVRPIKPFEKRWHLADEPTFYRLTSLDPLHVDSLYTRRGTILADVFTSQGLLPRVAEGCIGLVGWISDLPLVDTMGLANRRIAHKEVKRRSRPGHEKHATREEAIEEGAVVSFDDYWGPGRWAFTRAMPVEGRLPLFLLKWDPVVASSPRLRVPDPAEQVRRMVERGERSEMLDALPFLRTFLADHPEREAILATLRGGLGAVAEFEPSLEDAPSSGDGFRVRQGGARPAGAQGIGWLASDAAPTGSFSIDLGPLGGREIRFALAGPVGAALRAELVVEGEVVLQAAPQGADRLRPVSWSTAPWEGRQGTLRFVDDDPGAEAVLLVDSIHWSAKRNDVRELLRKARRADVALLARAEQVLPADDPDLAALASRFRIRWDLDRELPPGSRIVGDAFGKGPVPGTLPDQAVVENVQGAGLLNSYHGRDEGTGRVELPSFEIDGGTIHLLVGGGKDCQRVYVGLEVDGRIVRRVCGRNDEVLRPHVFPTRGLEGRIARIVAVDEATGPWGHILLDAVAVEAASEGPEAIRPTLLRTRVPREAEPNERR